MSKEHVSSLPSSQQKQTGFAPQPQSSSSNSMLEQIMLNHLSGAEEEKLREMTRDAQKRPPTREARKSEVAFATNYLSMIEEEKIKELTGELNGGIQVDKEETKAHSKNTVVPLKAGDKEFAKMNPNQKGIDVTMDMNDDVNVEFPVDSDLSAAATSTEYMSLLKDKIEQVSSGETKNNFQVVNANPLLRQFRSDAQQPNSVLWNAFKNIDKQLEKIKRKAFRWPLEYNFVDEVFDIVQLTEFFKKQKECMFVDWTVLASVFPPTLFTRIWEQPLYPSDNDTEEYLKVVDFQAQLISSFTKVYIKCPMSHFCHLNVDSLSTIDPFTRSVIRRRNKTFYRKSVEEAFGFRLFDVCMKLLTNFSSAEFPTFEDTYKPYVFVLIYQMICLGFEYGLFVQEEAEQLFSRLAIITETILVQQVTLQKALFDQKATQPIRPTDELNLESEMRDTDVVADKSRNWPQNETGSSKEYSKSVFLKQIGQIRNYCAKSVVHMISLTYDPALCEAIKTGKVDLSKLLLHKPELMKSLSTIVFKFLVRKFESGVDKLDKGLESSLTLILEFFTNKSEDFCLRSAKETTVDIIKGSENNLEMEDQQVAKVDAKIRDLTKLIFKSSDKSFVTKLDEMVQDICVAIDHCFQNPQLDSNYCSLALVHRNVHNRIINYLNLYSNGATRKPNMLLSLMQTIARMMKRNKAVQGALFSERNFDAISSIFSYKPDVVVLMFIEGFAGDYSYLHTSTVGMEAMTMLCKKLFMKSEVGGDGNNPEESGADTLLRRKTMKEFTKASSQAINRGLRFMAILLLQSLKQSSKEQKFNRSFYLQLGNFIARHLNKEGLNTLISNESNGFEVHAQFEKATKLDIDFLTLQVDSVELQDKQSPEQLQQTQYVCLKLFNQVTSPIMSEKSFNFVVGLLGRNKAPPVGSINPSSFIFQKELLKMARNTLLEPTDRLFICPKKMQFTTGFFKQELVIKALHGFSAFISMQIDWLKQLFSDVRFKRDIRDHKPAQFVRKYLLKGLFPSVRQFVHLVKLRISNLAVVEGANKLFIGIDTVINGIMAHSELYRHVGIVVEDEISPHKQVMSFNNLSAVPGVERRVIGSDHNILNAKIVVEQSGSDICLGGQEFFESIKKLKSKAVIFDKYIATMLDTSEEPVIDKNKRKSLEKEFGSKRYSFFGILQRAGRRLSELTSLRSTAPEKVMDSIHQRVIAEICADKEEYFNQKKTNEIVILFCQSSESKRLNDHIAKYFIDDMYYMNQNLDFKDPSSCYYLNGTYQKSFRALIKLIEWSPQLKFSINALFEKQIPKYSECSVFTDIPQPAKALQNIFGVFLKSINFTYFLNKTGGVRDCFWEDCDLMNDLIGSISYQNTAFKSYLNDPRMSQVMSFDVLNIEAPQTIVGETFAALYFLAFQSAVWRNTSSVVVESDRVDSFKVIKKLIYFFVDMLTNDTKKFTSVHYQVGHDVWKGIIMRNVSPQSTKLCKLKYAVVLMLNTSLQYLENSVVSTFDDAYDADKLYRQMVASVKNLYLSYVPVAEKKDGSKVNALADIQRHLNVFKLMSEDTESGTVITSYRSLLNLYKRNSEFSDHYLMKFAVAIYIFLSQMASKAKFYSIFLDSRRQEAISTTKFSLLSADSSKAGEIEAGAITYFLSKITGTVEVLSEKLEADKDRRMLKTEYFQYKPEAFFYTNSMSEKFYSQAPLNGTSEKMEHLVTESIVSLKELTLNRKLATNVGFLSYFLNGDAFTYYNYFLLIISFVLNAVMLAYMENPTGTAGLIQYPDEGRLAVTVIAWILVGFAGLFLGLWLLTRSNLEYEMLCEKYKLRHKREPTADERLKIILSGCFLDNERSCSYVFHIIFTVLGIYVDEAVFTLNFLLLMNVSGDIWYILHSVWDQFDKILATLFLSLLVLFSFSYLLLIGFSENFGSTGTSTCTDFASCFLNTIIYGFIPGSGIGEVLDPSPNVSTGTQFWKNFFLELTFFILVKLILINVINSIIINTFNDLRSKYVSRLYQEENICYICSDSKWRIQKAGVDFDNHRENAHNVKSYAFYLIYLELKSQSSKSETEEYVSKCYSEFNCDWIPQNMHLKTGENFAIVNGHGVRVNPEAMEPKVKSASKDPDQAETQDEEAEVSMSEFNGSMEMSDEDEL